MAASPVVAKVLAKKETPKKLPEIHVDLKQSSQQSASKKLTPSLKRRIDRAITLKNLKMRKQAIQRNPKQKLFESEQKQLKRKTRTLNLTKALKAGKISNDAEDLYKKVYSH